MTCESICNEFNSGGGISDKVKCLVVSGFDDKTTKEKRVGLARGECGSGSGALKARKGELKKEIGP